MPSYGLEGVFFAAPRGPSRTSPSSGEGKGEPKFQEKVTDSTWTFRRERRRASGDVLVVRVERGVGVGVFYVNKGVVSAVLTTYYLLLACLDTYLGVYFVVVEI